MTEKTGKRLTIAALLAWIVFQLYTSTSPSQELQDGRIKFFEFASGITGGKSPMDSRISSISV